MSAEKLAKHENCASSSEMCARISINAARSGGSAADSYSVFVCVLHMCVRERTDHEDLERFAGEASGALRAARVHAARGDAHVEQQETRRLSRVLQCAHQSSRRAERAEENKQKEEKGPQCDSSAGRGASRSRSRPAAAAAGTRRRRRRPQTAAPRRAANGSRWRPRRLLRGT